MTLKLVKAPIAAKPSNEKEVRDLLFRFELSEEKRRRIVTENRAVFDALDEIESEQTVVRDMIKRLLHTKEGPPDEVPAGASSHTWARGNFFSVSVQYKRASDYYDPAKLPLAVFLRPGVVAEVHRDILDKLAKTDKRISGALVHGAWMTPAVSISANKR